MPRVTPTDRIADLIRTASEVFSTQGYRRTQMADIADALGVAKGTLYLYVESKEALFDLACRYADRPRDAENLSLPIRTPKAGATLRFVREELQRNEPLGEITSALARKRVPDIARELRGIVTELYDVLARNRARIKLVDRSARDYPELAALWFAGARGGLLARFRAYLEDRIGRGLLAQVPDVATAARLVLETIVFWAVHRHFEANPEPASDDVARETIVHFVVRALSKE